MIVGVVGVRLCGASDYMIRQVQLEQHEPPVDGVNEPDLPRHQVHGVDAAEGGAASASGGFVVNVRGCEAGTIPVGSLG